MDYSDTAVVGVHEQLPHFRVRTTGGREVDYAVTLWQHVTLVLVSLVEQESNKSRAFLGAITAKAAELNAMNAALVVTADAIPKIPRPSVLIADRWGEIQMIAPVDDDRWPAADDLIDWVRYVEMQCPECQGEVR